MPLEPIEEKDLDLEAKFAAGRARDVERGSVSDPEKKVVPETVAAEKDAAYQQILSKVQGQAPTGPAGRNVADDARAVNEKKDAESQITHLVELASQKGVIHAVKVAQHLENNFILDSFHDRLISEELHKALLEKGLIQEL